MLNSPFRLPRHTRFGLIESAIEKFIGLNILERLYEPEYRHQYSGKAFLKRVLEIFNVSYEVARGSISSIPDSGPSIIVANHPFGGIEGVALADLLLQRHYKDSFIHKLGCCLEMGRSFVRPEYQKSLSALLMLWKGIGAYVAANLSSSVWSSQYQQ